MACACKGNRATASATAVETGTYRVHVNGRIVYETTNQSAATTVAERFDDATILAPGETA